MTMIEQKFLDWCERHKFSLFLLAITALSAIIRLSGLNFQSNDYDFWLRPWFDEIQAKGGLLAISQQVGDYNVLYQLLIALMTYLPFHPLTLYKGLSFLFDYLLAICAALTVYEFCRNRLKSVLAYASVLLLPSVFIDSAFWAQCDSIYCFFLLASFLCILKKRETLAFVFISIAFQFKLQTIFIFPFLLYYYVCSRRFSLLNFAMIPMLSVMICLLCGRGPFDTFKIYLSQTATYDRMSLNFPGIWNMISDHYDALHTAATLLTIAVLGIGLLLLLHTKPILHNYSILTLLILSLWTTLLILPAMHERYAYYLLILLLIQGILKPRLLGYLAACKLSILVGYCKFLWGFTFPANIPSYACAAVFIAAYIHFLYQTISSRQAIFFNQQP